jgi:hypothetical protein
MRSNFLSIKERRDSTALELLKAKQDNFMQGLVAEVRNLQLQEAQYARDALRASRSGPMSRYAFYGSLAGSNPATLSETDVTYQPIRLTIPKPASSDNMVLSDAEQDEVSEASLAQDLNKAIAYLRRLPEGCRLCRS